MHIAIITWGHNSEREISLRSWQATFQAAQTLGYQASLYDFPVDTARFLEQYKTIDFVFIMIHGRGGEDGQIASFLEVLWLPYHCTSPEVLQLTMNKRLTKQVWRQHNIPVANDSLIDLTSHIPVYTWPCVIKALDQGSSVGVRICTDAQQFHTALTQAKPYRTIMIESYLTGREVTVAVIDDHDGIPLALPIVEIIPPEGASFDYTNKYNNLTQELCPANFDNKTTNIIQDIAIRAYQAVGCTKYGRIDMIITTDGPICLEINTIPGFTSASLFPKAAAAYGWSFEKLVDHLIKLGTT